MQKYLDKLCEEEAEKLEKKREEQIQLREDLHKCNADIIRRKELNKEQVIMTTQILSTVKLFLFIHNSKFSKRSFLKIL